MFDGFCGNKDAMRYLLPNSVCLKVTKFGSVFADYLCTFRYHMEMLVAEGSVFHKGVSLHRPIRALFGEWFSSDPTSSASSVVNVEESYHFQTTFRQMVGSTAVHTNLLSGPLVTFLDAKRHSVHISYHSNYCSSQPNERGGSLQQTSKTKSTARRQTRLLTSSSRKTHQRARTTTSRSSRQ